MARDITAAVASAASSRTNAVFLLADFAFDSGEVNFWTGIGSLTYNGKTYVGTGNMGAVSEVTETQNAQAYGIVFQLSGINSSLISLAVNETYQGRRCALYLAFLSIDASYLELAGGGTLTLAGGGTLELAGAGTIGELLADPVPLFKGYMDVMEVEDNGATSTLKLSAESVLAKLKRTKEGRYTDENQKAKYPGDTGLSRINQLQDKRVTWGRNDAGA